MEKLATENQRKDSSGKNMQEHIVHGLCEDCKVNELGFIK